MMTGTSNRYVTWNAQLRNIAELMKGNNEAENEFDTNFSCMVGMMHAKLVIDDDDDDDTDVDGEFVSINPCNEKDTTYVRLRSSTERNITKASRRKKPAKRSSDDCDYDGYIMDV